MIKLYEFKQNNSGGSFDEDEDLAWAVFIEAGDIEEANGRAENLGIYFDGCNIGYDCECCGDRWSAVTDDDYDSESYATEEVAMKGLQALANHYGRYWQKEHAIVVHMKNGERYYIRGYKPESLKGGDE